MSNPLTPAEIAELDRLNAARTQGEWFDIEHPEWSGSNHRIDTKATAAWCNFGQICYTSAPNAAFIVAAANNMDRLLATIREQQELLSEALNPNPVYNCQGRSVSWEGSLQHREWKAKVGKILEEEASNGHTEQI